MTEEAKKIVEALRMCNVSAFRCEDCPVHIPAQACENDLNAADLIESLYAELDEAQPKWISVDERLPEREVLAANFAPKTYGYKEYIIGYVSRGTEPGKCYATNDYEILYDVTHWMPLPDAPKED